MSMNLNGLLFPDSQLLSACHVPHQAGIYVIMAFDVMRTPAYRVLYIGQSGDLAERGFPQSHECYTRWRAEVRSEFDLRISVCLLPNCSEQQRKAIESQLIAALNPPCNIQGVPRGDRLRTLAGSGRAAQLQVDNIMHLLRGGPSPEIIAAARSMVEGFRRPEESARDSYLQSLMRR